VAAVDIAEGDPLARRAELIRQSHHRSAALGLSRGERLAFEPMMRSDLSLARERNQRLYWHAAPVMQVLFEQIAGTHSMLVLTDAHGTILHTLGDAGFLARASRVALEPGENWAEHAKGTNAIGTALFDQRPTLVHADEHYIRANGFLTCSAAPIFDPRGQVLGVLDVTGDHRSYHPHTMGLVRMSARMIENHWLGDDHPQCLRLHFHAQPAFIGTLLEGIVAVDADGRLLGGNRSALEQLGLSDSSLRAQTLDSLFGTSLAGLHRHFQRPLAEPIRAVLTSGQSLHVSARWRAAPRPQVQVQVQGSVRPLRPTVQPPVRVPALAGRNLQALRTGDAGICKLVEQLQRLVGRDVPLVFIGEAGTGKQTWARAVHADSTRAAGPFVAVDCSTLPPERLEAELFGNAPADPIGSGWLLRAAGGTAYLSAIETLPLAAQARLLRLLQSGRVPAAGGDLGPPLDVVLTVGSARPLPEAVDQGRLRADLQQHLQGRAFALPPLRERQDLPELARQMVQACRPDDPPAIAPAALARLGCQRWPGNLREMQQVLRAAAWLSGDEGEIGLQHLPPDGQPTAAPASPAMPTLHDAESELIRRTLQALGGNISAAARQLGIGRNTLYRRLRESGR
jgi:transcriptional regulator of acetoin/glycerol metabolism